LKLVGILVGSIAIVFVLFSLLAVMCSLFLSGEMNRKQEEAFEQWRKEHDNG